MKKFRFVLILALSMIFMFSLFACTSGERNTSSSSKTQISTSAQETSISSVKPSTSSSKPVTSTSSVKPSTSSSKPATSTSSVKPSTSSSSASTSSQVDRYSVTVTPSVGGTVTPSLNEAASGTTITLTVEKESGYRLEWLKVDGTTVTVNNNIYSFVISKNVTITYSFVREYTISITDSTGGAVTANKSVVLAGEQVELTVVPNSNYVLSWLNVNGVPQTVSNNKCTITVNADVTVTSGFVRVYTINTNATTNGTFTVSKTSATAGETITVTATPNTDYIASQITVSYGSTDINLDISDNTASFEMPSAEVDISVTFAKQEVNREYVSHLILGDSYTHHEVFWNDFYADMSHLPAPKIIGIGGTQVPQWGGLDGYTFVNTPGESGTGINGNITQFQTTTDVNIIGKYNVQNFVFHIGVNDIDAGFNRDDVISDLKTLFDMYHEAYPNANIYWISISLNTMFPQYTDSYKYVNSQMEAYLNADANDYLHYIDTCSTMFPDGNANGDLFMDGLHYNADGYSTWSSLIAEGLGYPRPKVGPFGNADIYYSANTWKESDGVVSNTTNALSEQNLFFDGVFSVDAYAEAKITVNSFVEGDNYPKFGMSVKTNGNHTFFFVDAAFGTGKGVSYTERKLKLDDGGGTFYESINWDWTIQTWSTATLNYDYNNGSYVKLGLLRSGADMYFFVNDVLALSKSGFEYCDGEGAIGFTVFNSNVSIKEYSVTTNIASKLSELGINNGGIAYFDGALNSISNTQTAGEFASYIQGVNHSDFYFEADMSVTEVIGGDEYPKFGIAITNAAGDTLLAYIDAVNTGAFGTNTWAGFVTRPSGGNWAWGTEFLNNASWLQTATGSYSVKLAVLKQGEKVTLYVNDTAVVSINNSATAGACRVGFMAFNLVFTVNNAKVATSNNVLNVLKVKGNDLAIDGNLSDWSATQKSNPYSATLTSTTINDLVYSGSFTAYSFVGTDGLYVGYEITSSHYVTNTSNWWESTNVEVWVNGKQTYISANGKATYLKDYAFVYSYDEASQTYKIIAEFVVDLNAVGVTEIPSSIDLTIATRIGPDGSWWGGALKTATTNGLSA